MVTSDEMTEIHDGWVADGRTDFWTHAVAVLHAVYLADRTSIRHRVRRVTTDRPLGERWQVEPVECACHVTPEAMWLSAASCGYGGGYEPGSQMEWNPDCPQHRPTPVHYRHSIPVVASV